MSSYNKVVVQRIDSPATGFATMVFTIKECVAEHNVVMELLKAIYHKFPGPWYQFQQELRKAETEEKVQAIKEPVT